MMKPNVTLSLAGARSILLALSLSLGLGSAFGAASISVSVAVPSGSAGKTYGTKILGSMVYTPCVGGSAAVHFGTDANVYVDVDPTADGRDAFTITVNISNEYDAKNKVYKWTPYLFVVNPMGGANALATRSPLSAYQVFAAKKYSLWGGGSTGVQFVPIATPADISRTAHSFMDTTDFVSTTVKEDVTGGGIFLDDQAAGSNLPQGLYYVLAILADQSSVSFSDPATWQYWNIAPFILGTPWATAGGTAGNTMGDCQ